MSKNKSRKGAVSKRMSILSPDDYYKEHKKFNKTKNHTRSKYHDGIAISTKIKYPSQHKTLNHKCSQCIRTDAKKYFISEKEARWLCIMCVNKHNNKNIKENTNFVKASKLWRLK